MLRFAKTLALTLPLILAVSCANECNGPEDCKQGELCLREVLSNGERGAAKCVDTVENNGRCATDSDCGDSGQLVCRAQRCRILGTTGTSTPTMSGDTGVANMDAAAPIPGRDAAPNADAAPPGNADAAMSNADAAMTMMDAGTSSTATITIYRANVDGPQLLFETNAHANLVGGNRTVITGETMGVALTQGFTIDIPLITAGTYDCSAPTTGFLEYRNMAQATFRAGDSVAGRVGTCTLTISSFGAVGDPIVGTFSATVQDPSGTLDVMVTNGQFNLLREADL